VAAARHVVIIYGNVELDGHAFPTGLGNIELSDSTSQDSDTSMTATSFRQASTVVSLVRGAIFRPVFKPSSSSRVTLDICTLGELISMYNTHQATQPHDKIYALLGMASDDISDAGLAPDYSVPWQQIQLRILSWVLGDKISVKMWPERDVAEIKGKGRVYGRVMTANRSSNGGQDIYLEDDENDYDRYEESGREWCIQTTSAEVCKGEIVYLLEGASKPILIRPFGAVFHVIALAATLTDRVKSELFPRQITLVWGWAKLPEVARSYSSIAPAEVKSYWNAVLALTDTKKDANSDEEAQVLMASLIEMASAVDIKRDTAALTETEASHSISGMREITQVEVVDLVRRFNSDNESNAEMMKQLLPWIPREIRNTEGVLIAIVECHDDELLAHILLEHGDDSTVVTEAVLLAALSPFKYQKEKVQVLLDHKGDKTFITEGLLAAAASLGDYRQEAIQLLLNYANDNALVTQTVLAAAAQSRNSVFPILLDCQADHLDISEAVVVAAAECGWYHNLELLLGDECKIEITEAVLVAVGGNYYAGRIHMENILRRKQDTPLQITESVLYAVAENSHGLEIIRHLRDHMGEVVEFLDGAITQKVLQAAAGNPHHDSVPLMRHLLDLMDKNIHITAPVIEAAMANEVMTLSQLRLICKRSDEALQIYLSMGGKEEDLVESPEYHNPYI
jgi:hypothetical protein